MAKKITLKNKNGDVLCPHTAIEQVQGLKEALDDKLGKTEKVSSATNADKLGGYSSSLYLKGTGVLESANFNEQKTVGIYRYNGVSDKNAPSEATAYGNLMVIRSGEHDTLSQLYLNSSNNRIFVRSGSNSDFTSKNWQTIAFTDSNVASASSLTPLTLDHADTTSNAGLTVYQLWTGDEGTDILPNGSMMLNMATNDGVKKQLLFGHPVGSNNNMVIQYRRRAGSWSDWKTVAFTDSTVASVIDGAISTSKIATAAITPAKIQTSIALNGTPSMTVEPTTSSPDKTIASVGLVKEVVEDIEIGGRNLFIASDVVLGGIDGSTGAENTGSVRAKSSGYIPVTGDILTAKSWDNSLKFMICYYNQSKAFLTSSWKENNNTWVETSVKKYAVPANTAYIRVLLAKNNNVAFTSSELSSIKIKIEQGNKATAWSPALEDIVNGIEIGGRNLVLNSDVVVENNTYVMYKCNTSEDLETDREYTMTIWGTLGSDRDSFRLYDSGVSTALGTFTLTSPNKYVLTFKYKGNYPRLLSVLQFNNTGTSSSIIQKVKLERGNKATDWSPAPEDIQAKIDGIEIGGRNLVVNSSTPISSTANFIGNLSLYENLIENSVYTITIWGELGADRTSFYLYPEWGMGGALCELQQVSNGVYNATFIYHKGNATNSNAVGLYQMPSTGTSTSTIQKVKVERGNKATDWSPAPEDVEAKIESVKPTIFLQTLQPSATEVKEGDIWIIQ